MSTHAPSSLPTPLFLDPELRERLEQLAKTAGRTVAELATAVLREFLDENERELAAIDAGIEEADAGQLVEYEDVKADVLRKLAAPAAGR